jgi:hypothetical protein
MFSRSRAFPCIKPNIPKGPNHDHRFFPHSRPLKGLGDQLPVALPNLLNSLFEITKFA